jgi:hypothetical protein
LTICHKLCLHPFLDMDPDPDPDPEKFTDSDPAKVTDPCGSGSTTLITVIVLYVYVPNLFSKDETYSVNVFRECLSAFGERTICRRN